MLVMIRTNFKKIIFFFILFQGIVGSSGIVKAQNYDNPPPADLMINNPPVIGPPEEQQSPKTAPIVKIKEDPDGYSAGKPVILDVLDLKNIDILDVLKLISQKSALNIVAGQNVTGRITVYLKNMEVQEALKIIVDAYGWAFAKEGQVLKVMTAKDFETKYGYKFGETLQTRIVQLLFANVPDVLAVLNQVKSASGKIISDEKSNTLILMDSPSKLEEMDKIIKRIDVPVQTEVFDLSYAKAEDISKKIAEALTPSLGKMRFDERSNKVIVSDSPSKMSDIKRIIGAFDEKDKQVLIEAKIMQITLNDDNKLGVDWEAIVSNYQKLDFKSSFSVLGTNDKRGRLSIGTLSTDDYTALVEALQTVGRTNILSNPSVTTVNNKEAKILVGSTQPYVTSTTTTPASGPTTTAETVNFIEVGVKLYVTPTIHNDDYITMKIKPEVSSVVTTITTGNNNSIPVVETSQAETTVNIKNGVTIVIGGLIKDQKVKSVKKVPVLGDIPLLGFAFKSNTDTVDKTEIVIFLTPKIITGDVQENKENSAP